MFPCIIFVFISAVVGLVVYAVVQEAKKAQEAWKSAGRKLGLAYSDEGLWGSRKLRGSVDGYRVKISGFKKSSGKSSSNWTKYQLLFSKENFEYHLSRSKALSGVAKFFGSQDIEVGSEEFDNAVVVKADRPKHIRSFLNPARQKAVMSLLLSYPGAEIKNGQVEWQNQGATTNAAEIEGVVRRFLRLARAMEGLEDPDDAVVVVVDDTPAERALEPIQVVGGHEPDEAGPIFDLEPVYEPPAPEPEIAPPIAVPVERAPPIRVEPNVFQPVIPEPRTDPEPESDPEPDPEPLADEAPDILETEPPKQAELQTDVGPASKPDTGPAHSPSSLVETSLGAAATLGAAAISSSEEPNDAAEVEAGTPLAESAADVSEDLFGEGALGSEIEKVYQEHYHGAVVTWTAKLERLDSYYSDFVFGAGPGTKATLTLHEIQGDYGSRTAEGMLQLSSEAADELRGRIGEELSFRGRLMKCEAFLRRLYIANGHVL